MATPFLFDEKAVADAQPCDKVGTLLSLDDAEFVASAYLSLLRRPADHDGLLHYTRKLREGHTKPEVLALIAGSREGRTKGAEVAGLQRVLSRYRWSRVPLVGAVFRYFADAEGYSAGDRHRRALQQTLLRQERSSHQLQRQMVHELWTLRQALTEGVGVKPSTPGAPSQDELIVQPNGQTPSVLSRFMKLERSAAEDVIAQFAELVKASFEAEQLATVRA